MLSFVVAGVACVFAALCYAEFASMVPVAGSAYTYAYATLGRAVRLDHRLGPGPRVRASASATVANGWSHYFQSFLASARRPLPPTPSRTRPFDYDPATGAVCRDRRDHRPAGGRHRRCIVTSILVKGIRESAGFNAAMVVIKLAVVLFVIVVGAFYINPANWMPFAPYG